MPYPAQMNAEKLVEQARTMIETEGVDNLSLHKLAAAFGVKAPSLYRHFASKNDLLRAVSLDTGQQLVDGILAATDRAGDARARVRAMARAYRAFVRANPMAYALLFSGVVSEVQGDAALLEQMALPLQAQMAAISGEDEALAALRGLWALLHGFVTLELNGQFRRGGDVDGAFERAVDAYIAGWG